MSNCFLEFEVPALLSKEEQLAMVYERNIARKHGDYKRADDIRNWFKEHGYIVEDKADGTTRVYR